MPAAKSPEFRRRALDPVAGGEPVAQVAKNLGISEWCLRRWKGQTDIDAGRAEGLTSTEKKELVELRRKNRVLELEVEIFEARQRLLRAGERAPKQGSGWSTCSPPMGFLSRWPAGC